MEKIIKIATHSIVELKKRKFLFITKKNGIIVDLKTNKKEFVSPNLTNMCDAFFSQDGTKALFMNTTGISILYDMLENKELAKIKFGDNFYNHHFAGYNQGFYYLKDKSIFWFDFKTLESKNLNFENKCWSIYDIGDKIFFSFIETDAYNVLYNQITLKCFSKVIGEFDAKKINLPMGVIDSFKRIDENVYLIQMSEKYKKGCCYSVFLYYYEKHSLDKLFSSYEFKELENPIGCLENIEIDLKDKKAYYLCSRQLYIIDLEEKKVFASYPIQYASDMKIVDDYLIIATWHGTYKISKEKVLDKPGINLC